MGPAAGAALGIGTGMIQDLWQLGIGNQMADQQMGRQKHMMNFQQQKMLEMWHKTGYGPTIEQMKKAGLNPALMYGMGGAGGQTAAGPTATAPMPSTPQHDNLGMGMQIAQQQKIIDANVKNIEADTQAKLAGIPKTHAETENLMQGLDNLKEDWVIKRLQQTMMNIQNYEQQTSQQDRLKTITYNAQQALNTLEILQNEKQISSATIQEKITIIQQEAIAAALHNEATKAGIKLTTEEITKIKETIKQQWESVRQGWQGLNQDQQKIAIQKFAENIKAATPNLMNVAGRAATDAIEAITRLILGHERSFMGPTVK